MAITKEASNQLKRIHENISTSYLAFKHNVTRFHDFRRYVFETTITERQATLLRQLGRPIIEANIQEAYISRLLGEFAKHEPSINLTPAEGVPVNEQILDVVEGYLRHVIYEANKNGMSYEVYKDLLSGGFSVIKVWTEYSSPMSLKQVIRTGRVFDPTLAGFDPMARLSHKGDGNYCFELFPMLEEDFKREYPEANHNFSFTRNVDEFSWSYRSQTNQKTTLICDYYEKKKKRTQIVELSNGKVITMRDYKRLAKFWEEQQFIAQMPLVVSKRWTELETICRYKLTECEVLEYEETDYTYLPLIFVDGNSVTLANSETNNTYQMTRPYIYQTKGIQDLKNFAMQSLAHYLQNIVQQKFIVMEESLPQQEDYIDLLTKTQQPGVIVMRAYSENNPDKPIPTPIREVNQPPAPPEIMGTFQIADPTTQTILGSYASNLGQNDNDLSGKAVIESASVGNSAAMPYVCGYLAAWTQLGSVIVDLIPKYIVGKRKLPHADKNGEFSYKEVNQEGMPALDYEESAIQCHIEAGVNFQVQKNQAVEQIIALGNSNPTLQQFFSDEDGGLPILAKNLTIYGADQLPEAIEKWSQKMQQQQQQMMQMQQEAMMSDPRMLKAQVDMRKVELEAQEQQFKVRQAEFDNQIEIAKQAVAKIVADAKLIESEAKVAQAQIDSAVRLEEAETSKLNHALDAAVKVAEVNEKEHSLQMKAHENHRENVKLHHEISKSKGEQRDNA